MATYYFKKAFIILQKRGPIELSKKVLKLILYNIYYPLFVHKIRPFRYRLSGYSIPPSPKDVLYIDPDMVKYRVRGDIYQYDKVPNYGKIRCGEWDKKVDDFENSTKHQACRERIKNDKSWEETGIIEAYADWVDGEFNGIDGCYSRQDVIVLYNEQREKLYQSIMKDGFDQSVSRVCCDVHIGRDGEIIYARKGGHHRLSMCKLLDVSEIPVRVIFRHEKWQQVREDVNKDGLPEGRGDLRDHPDLQHVF